MNIESLSQIKNAEIYLMHNGINPDTLAPADIAIIQEELETSPCEITFNRSEKTNGKTVITAEGKVLMEEFFAKFSMTPDEAPPVIRTMAEDIVMRVLSNGCRTYENGFGDSTELAHGTEAKL